MPKTVAISQSNYIPWKGYFDIINSVDLFILYDDMQYTRRDWRNRNQIKTPKGVEWLTIPVEVKGKYHQKICETQIADKDWCKSHWQTIKQNYSKAKFFKDYETQIAGLYERATLDRLSDVNRLFLTEICKIIGISTQIEFSMKYEQVEGKTERLVDLCKQVGATKYISGPAAKEYMDESMFKAAGIAVEYASYEGYPTYTQLYGDFTHGVTILDLLFNEGPRSKEFMKSFLNKKA